jgi:hypothetical protein
VRKKGVISKTGIRPILHELFLLGLSFTLIPSLSPTPARDSFHVLVKYIGQEVLKREVIGSDVRIAYLPSSPVPPTLMMGGFPRIPLPESPSTLTSSPGIGPQLQALSTLLPFMEKGVILTSTGAGIYAKRYCQGRVFWTGPHSTTTGPHKMNRAVEPVLLFDREAFKMGE